MISQRIPFWYPQMTFKNLACRVLLGVSNMGTIEKGKLADLLVVEGNPLKDIKATRNVRIVVKGGEIYSPKRLLNSI